MVMKTRKKTSITDKKRRGLHHNHGHHYKKVYLPYLPLLLVIGVGVLLGNFKPPMNNKGILAYSTNISQDSLLVATNYQRTQNNQSALGINNQLTAAAQAKANDMVARNYWSHTTPDGQEPWAFIQQADYKYQKAGENLAYGFDTSNNIVAGWMNSEDHRANLLDSAYSEVGFGYANSSNYQNTGPETVVVAMYGSRVKGISTTPSSPSALSTENPMHKSATIAVSHIQTLTNGQAPWTTFAAGLFIGAVVVYLVIKHGLAIKRALKEGETFILHHAMFDVILVGLVIIATFLTRVNGFIL